MSQRIKAVNLRSGGYVTAQGHDNHALWKFCGEITAVYEEIMKAADLNTEFWQEELVDSGTFFRSGFRRVRADEWGENVVSVICAVFNAFLGAIIVFNIRKYTRRVDGAVANINKTEVHINEMYANCVAERLAVMNERLAITLLVSGAEFADVLPLLSDAKEDSNGG